MTLRKALRQGRATLRAAGVEDADFEAEYLLRHSLGCSRESLFMGLDAAISPSELHHYNHVVRRRAASEPSAYITGRREFYGLEFRTDPRALIPRPETELLIELALEFATHPSQRERPLKVVEVGVGCGAVSVALAVHLPDARIAATDVSPEALELAEENALSHGVRNRIELLQGDLLTPVSSPIDVLISNPPYVPSADLLGLPREIRDHEPRLALDGGPEGASVILRLLAQAGDKMAPGGAIFMEIGSGLGARLLAHARDLWPEATISLTPDLAGLDRVLGIRAPVGAALPS